MLQSPLAPSGRRSRARAPPPSAASGAAGPSGAGVVARPSHAPRASLARPTTESARHGGKRNTEDSGARANRCSMSPACTGGRAATNPAEGPAQPPLTGGINATSTPAGIFVPASLLAQGRMGLQRFGNDEAGIAPRPTSNQPGLDPRSNPDRLILGRRHRIDPRSAPNRLQLDPESTASRL